ncbi:putative ATP synthase F1, epsilon subunit [Methylococcus capsulatus str. Bath]|jgi:F-type H+-transporting ATPase subunit epsilon|uniref:ATP synthase epsilon chain n=1 Tax=Methylococcus capsulatus (strain ATCC 33009 / NCIMB 11132 / Bath) TaxID=243233 RepID=Q608D5_METCA|nr:hypothetical protein [Methylococcus capsulatus]AAU92174.1 putative ATP synthase F1, epsilon subunit [Methylococcus capsulatus str. Bath]
MRTFALSLRDTHRCEEIEGIETFVGADDTGSFAIRAGHAPLIAALGFGLARFKPEDSHWRYLAVPGAMLNFVQNRLEILTRRFYLFDDYRIAAAALREELEAEERSLAETRASIRTLERHMLKRLWQLRREGIRL